MAKPIDVTDDTFDAEVLNLTNPYWWISGLNGVAPAA